MIYVTMPSSFVVIQPINVVRCGAGVLIEYQLVRLMEEVGN